MYLQGLYVNYVLDMNHDQVQNSTLDSTKLTYAIIIATVNHLNTTEIRAIAKIYLFPENGAAA